MLLSVLINSRQRCSFLLASALYVASLSACEGCLRPTALGPTNLVPVSQRPSKFADIPDAAVEVYLKPFDAGTFNDFVAGEPCAENLYAGLPDAGPDVKVATVGLCIALRTMTGAATLNGAPVANSQVDLRWLNGTDYQLEAHRPTDSFGRFEVKVLKGKYEDFQFHPDGVFKSHEGYIPQGGIDLSKNAFRDLNTNSHLIRGSARFSTLPFLPSLFPPDVVLEASGDPPAQRVSVMSVGGSYEVALLEGVSSIWLTSPAAALGGTELIRYPVNLSVDVSAPSQVDIDIPTHEFEGEVRIDGLPIPDRKAGPDFVLDYTPTGIETPRAKSYHEGGLPGVHAILPKDRYSVKLQFETVPNSTYPSQVFNKLLTPQIDVRTKNVSANFNLSTVVLEGGILIDGKPPQLNKGDIWEMYAFGFASAVEPQTMLFFRVPFDTASFALRLFPNDYAISLKLDDRFVPNLVTGLHLIDRRRDVYKNQTLSINVETALLSGRLLIDGAPPLANRRCGTLYFQGVTFNGAYQKDLVTTGDGSFAVRVPAGGYKVFFVIDREAYPEYAAGRQEVIPRIDMDEDREVSLAYDTWLVQGPLRLGGEVVPDKLASADFEMTMMRRDYTQWVWGFAGGTPHYRMRIPEGIYQMAAKTLAAGDPSIAWGEQAYGPLLVLPPGTGYYGKAF